MKSKPSEQRMIVTVRVKCSGYRSLEKKVEIKGPFNTGGVVTVITGVTGKVLQKLSNDYIEVLVEPSDYSKCEADGFQRIF
jgi:hypothetical protein